MLPRVNLQTSKYPASSKTELLNSHKIYRQQQKTSQNSGNLASKEDNSKRTLNQLEHTCLRVQSYWRVATAGAREATGRVGRAGFLDEVRGRFRVRACGAFGWWTGRSGGGGEGSERKSGAGGGMSPNGLRTRRRRGDEWGCRRGLSCGFFAKKNEKGFIRWHMY
jgi:hypothetical protein